MSEEKTVQEVRDKPEVTTEKPTKEKIEKITKEKLTKDKDKEK